MSACLFTVSEDFFTHLSIDEINESIKYWEDIIVKGPDGLFGGKDQIAACVININIAKSELKYRNANTTAHAIKYIIAHELRNGAPNLKKALMDASSNGIGYCRFTNKNSDKWFEYVTEDELRKVLKP